MDPKSQYIVLEFEVGVPSPWSRLRERGVVAEHQRKHDRLYSSLPAFIPLYTVLQRRSGTTKDIKCATNGQIHAAVTQFHDPLQIVGTPAAPCIRDRNLAPRRQTSHELLVDASLQAFVVGGMHEELRAERFQQLDRLCSYRAGLHHIPSIHLNVCMGATVDTPWQSSISVNVCHLFIATNQLSFFRLQLRSITSLSLSPCRAFNRRCRCSFENVAFGNRYDVTMTYTYF